MKFQGSGLPLGGNGEPIQVAGGIKTQDGTGTPLTSPLTVSTENELIPPEGALILYLNPTTDAIKFGTTTGFTQSVNVAVDTTIHIPVANGASIFVDKVTANSTLNFYFEHVNTDNT